jgi:hypothetical protein
MIIFSNCLDSFVGMDRDYGKIVMVESKLNGIKYLIKIG